MNANTYNSGLAAIFVCPICRSAFTINNGRFVCLKGHSFDIAKHRYVNFFGRPAKTKYAKSLFESRRIVHQAGLWDEMLDLIYRHVTDRQYDANALKPPLLLDAGCGEGSHLASITGRMNRSGLAANGIGADISREAVQLAAKAYKNAGWCVADLANPPFAEHSFDVILNLLSPASYRSFHRLLKAGGLLLKVIPNPDYLIELREALLGCPVSSPTNEPASLKPAALFKQHMADAKAERIRYSFTAKPALLKYLAQMTPLFWNIADSGVYTEALLNRPNLTLTVDLTVLSGYAAK